MRAPGGLSDHPLGSGTPRHPSTSCKYVVLHVPSPCLCRLFFRYEGDMFEGDRFVYDMWGSREGPEATSYAKARNPAAAVRAADTGSTSITAEGARHPSPRDTTAACLTADRVRDRDAPCNLVRGDSLSSRHLDGRGTVLGRTATRDSSVQSRLHCCNGGGYRRIE